jgi:hypothetical protein
MKYQTDPDNQPALSAADCKRWRAALVPRIGKKFARCPGGVKSPTGGNGFPPAAKKTKNQISTFLIEKVRSATKMTPAKRFRSFAQGEDDMKLQSATHGTDRVKSARTAAYLSRESTLLASGVALAFAFVTACIFMLG